MPNFILPRYFSKFLVLSIVLQAASVSAQNDGRKPSETCGLYLITDNVAEKFQRAGIQGIDQATPTVIVELVFNLSQYGRGARDIAADSTTGLYFDGWHQVAAHYKPLEDGVGFLKLVAHLDKHYGRQLARLQREFSLQLNPRGDNHNQGLTFGAIVVRGELQNIVQAMQATDSSGKLLVPHISPTDWKPGLEPDLLPAPRNRTN